MQVYFLSIFAFISRPFFNESPANAIGFSTSKDYGPHEPSITPTSTTGMHHINIINVSLISDAKLHATSCRELDPKAWRRQISQSGLWPSLLLRELPIELSEAVWEHVFGPFRVVNASGDDLRRGGEIPYGRASGLRAAALAREHLF